MKLCYIDETGTDGKSPVLVVAGVVVDGVRSSTTRMELDRIFGEAARQLDKPPKEIKGSDLYQKKNAWRNVDGPARHAIFGQLCELVVNRKHDIALSAIDIEQAILSPLAPTISTWTAGALHVALQIQRNFQRQERNKGQSLLVYDHHRDAEKLISHIQDPETWMDDFYGRDSKQAPFDAIIDVPLFADSCHIGLLQIADVLAFMFRRHLELHDFGMDEDFIGESAQLADIVGRVEKRLIRRSNRYPRLAPSHTAIWFLERAPSAVRK